MDLILPDAARLQPLDQCAGLLLLGQGFTSKVEFLALARATAAKLTERAPFNTVLAGVSNQGKLAILADATIGVDLGVTAAVAAAPRALGLAGTGSRLEKALDALAVPAITGSAAMIAKASQFWGLSHFGGSTTKLVVIIRKPQAGATPGEYYSLPVVVVDVDPAREWWRLILRALSQSLAGLADEFTRQGPEWAAPPAGWVTDSLDPASPPMPHRLGRNTIIFNDAQKAKLGAEPISDIFPGLDPAWFDRFYGGITPYRANSMGSVAGSSSKATVRVAQGGSGFRIGVLRCDQPCVMAQAPAEPLSTVPQAPGDPVGAPPVDLCPVCSSLVVRVLGTGWETADTAPRPLDRQVSHYDLARFSSRTPLAVTSSTPTKVTQPITSGATWEFEVGLESTGLVIRSLKLADRPNDPMSDSEDVAESIMFSDIAYDVGAGRQPLNVVDALANTNQPPVMEIGKNSHGQLRVGTRLTLHWEPEDGLLIRADLSLTCRDIAFDFDPGGAAEACKFYPEMVLTWTRSDGKVPPVRSLHGCVTITANNRLTGTHHGHSGMKPNSQLVMLLTDSNTSKHDAAYDFDLVGSEMSVLGLPIAVPIGAQWQSGRLLGAMKQTEAQGAYFIWRHGGPPLPEWSWLFDYGRAVGVGLPEVVEVVCWEDTHAQRGAPWPRKMTVAWPPIPDPALGFPPGKSPAITVSKLPRQGAYDNIHINVDMGLDKNRPVVAAPFCADLCLHLHVRWGVHAVDASKNRPPFLGWSSGTHAYSHSTLGAPLVPPNQRISFGVSRPDATKTKIRYIAEIVKPVQGKRQVVLEQGLGFAFSYKGLEYGDRLAISLVYGGTQGNLTVLGFRVGMPDSAVREFFRGIYTRIRFLDYGFPAILAAPQQVPIDVFPDPDAAKEPLFFKLVDL